MRRARSALPTIPNSSADAAFTGRAGTVGELLPAPNGYERVPPDASCREPGGGYAGFADRPALAQGCLRGEARADEEGAHPLRAGGPPGEAARTVGGSASMDGDVDFRLPAEDARDAAAAGARSTPAGPRRSSPAAPVASSVVAQRAGRNRRPVPRSSLDRQLL
ncbi:hypothetical protein ABIA38_003360 [Embleya sp. AB8]